MIRKNYNLKEWVTFDDIMKVTQRIEKKMPHLHCRVEIHRKVFEVVCKEGEMTYSQQLMVHDLCRKLWDKNFKET